MEKLCGKIYIREVYKSELTELKARDTSCPKGKKVEDIQYIFEQVQESSHVKELTQCKFRSTERRIRINSPYFPPLFSDNLLLILFHQIVVH